MWGPVLFLDDSEDRHREFSRAAEKWPHATVIRAFTADAAIAELRAGVPFVQVFLDHDLCIDDTLILPGATSKERTGMDVVDFIVSMPTPPQDIVVHSLNGPASAEMVRRLEGCRRVDRVRAIPFTKLIALMRSR